MVAQSANAMPQAMPWKIAESCAGSTPRLHCKTSSHRGQVGTSSWYVYQRASRGKRVVAQRSKNPLHAGQRYWPAPRALLELLLVG